MEDIRADNARLYNLLMPLLHGTGAYKFIRQPKLEQNGRAIWLILKEMGSGQHNQSTRRNAAQTGLNNTTLDVSNRGDPAVKFERFVNHLQTNFNEVGPAFSEDEKVRVLFRQLGTNPRFEACRPTVLASPYYRDSFHNTITLLTTIASTAPSNPKESTRNVSAATSTKDVGRLPKEEWDKLSKAQRLEHLKKMKSGKPQANTKRKPTEGMSRGQKKEFKRLRTIESLHKSTDNEKGKSSSPGNPDPSAEFGTKVAALATKMFKDNAK